jgi:hypothetical protein
MALDGEGEDWGIPGYHFHPPEQFVRMHSFGVAPFKVLPAVR